MAIVLNNITSGYNLAKINANFQNIEDYINDKLLARADTGVAGEAMMERALDMNGNKILNVFVDVNDANSLLTVGVADSRYYNVSGDTLTGPMNANSQIINNLPSPTSSSQAATKAYVDAVQADVDGNESRSLRFPEVVEPMGPVSVRASSLQGYNDAGKPIPVFSMTGTADLAIKLASTSSGLGDALVGHVPYDTSAGAARTVASKLNESRSILDWPADAVDDDSARFTKAIAAGVTSIYIPNPEVLTREIGRAYLLIKNISIASNVLIWGDGKAGFRQVGGAIRVRDDASYGFYFVGTGNGTDSGVRVIGGGIVGISMMGQTSANTSTFIKTLHASSMEFSNVSFRNGGTAFYLQDFMESRITNCYFNSFGSETADVIHIGDFVDSAPWNVNNLHIENCTFGSNSGHWIYMSDSANADLIWIHNNKFEWDSTPTNANSTNKSVIYAGRVERLYIQNNGFVYFYTAHNLYDTIFKLGTAAAYGAVFTNNTAWGCDNSYYWQVNGGSLLARGNKSNASMVVACTSAYSQDIEPPLIRSSVGNRPTSYFAKQYDSNFTPAHYLTGATASANFTTDSDAVINGTCQLAAVSSELRRITVPKDMFASGRVIKVTARVKNTNASPAQIQLLCDGSAVTNYNSALDDQATYLTIPASSGWTTVTWNITPALMTSVGALIVRNNSTVTFLFDGITVEYATSVDLTIPWTPGTVSANSVVNTTVLMTRLGPYVKGISLPYANGSLAGTLASCYFQGASNLLVVQLGNITASSAATTASSFKVRVFL